MNLSDDIGKTHMEAMEKILAFITSFDVHKLLYAISVKRLDEDDIASITLDIREQNVKLERQKKYLFDYTKICNKEYALPNNKLVDESARLSHKMRSGIRGIKDTVRAFCKSSRRRWPEGKGEPQAIDHSLIATEAYMKDLFGLTSYPECVKELFVEMVKFFNNMNECLEEAQRSLAEEKDTRKNKKVCLELLKRACERNRQSQIIFVEAMESDPMLKSALQQSKAFQPHDENPVLKEYVRSCGSDGDKGTFASTFYHNCSPEDVGKITFYKTTTEANGDPDLIACMTIFNCSAEKARQINHAISCFDTLLPEKPKRETIPSIHLHVFMRWCSETIGHNAFLNYFNKRYEKAGGHWTRIGSSALSGASAQWGKSTEKYQKVQADIMSKLEKMLTQFYNRHTA